MCYTLQMKGKKKTQLTQPSDILLVDESVSIHRKRGNGTIRRQIWVTPKGKVTRYSLAYINHHLSCTDNGRVLGYDNAHGYHHKHYMGNIEAVEFKSFEALEKQFDLEFEVLHAKVKKHD